MRLRIDFTPSENSISIYDIQKICNKFVHTKLIGNNNKYHDTQSNYCVTPLVRGGIAKDKTISYPNGSYMVITSQDEEFINSIYKNLFSPDLEIPELKMKLSDINIIEETFTNGNNYLTTLTPILLKNENNRIVTYKDVNKEEYIRLLKSKIIYKINKFNPDHNIKYLDFDYNENDTNFNKTRNIDVNGIKNNVSQLNLKITTDRKTAELIYNLGLGQSTGSGFGTIYNTNNYESYRF
jgi:CRISPR-associated endoribonuclease Cas6